MRAVGWAAGIAVWASACHGPGAVEALAVGSYGDVAVVGATVVHDPALPALEDATVLVRSGAVVALGPSDRIAVPRSAVVVRGEGLWMIPGLWDMHVHLTDATELAMPLLLANGVTGVRDMGGSYEAVSGMERRRRAGELAGPRIVLPGPYVDGPKRGLPNRITVETAAEGRAAADSLSRLGVDFIKVHNGVPPAAYFALLDRSAAVGLTVAGHVPLAVDPASAVRAGHGSLEHFVTIFEGTLRERTSGLDALRGYMADGLDTLVQAVAATDAYLTPTVYSYLVRARRGELAVEPDPRLRYVARSLRDQWDAWYPVQERDHDARLKELREEFYRVGLEIIGRFREWGVPILAGTDLGARDALPGFDLHEELASLVDAGLEPSDALAAATTVPARYLGADSLGAIAVGHRADFVLLEADPRVDIHNTRRIRAVIADGRYYDRDALDALLASVAARAEEH
jgi:imidazolonepropionase-like amidohydrolase